jgi:cytidylate kinase
MNNLRIAISGKSGCGNTTVSRLTAEALGLRFVNFTFRNLAQEQGLELVDLLGLAAKDDAWDREVDSRQIALARGGVAAAGGPNTEVSGATCGASAEGADAAASGVVGGIASGVAAVCEAAGCVLGSRLAIWMLPEADIKVYLKARPETRTKRIIRREGGTLEEVAAFTAERDRQDRERYLRIYNIDNDDYAFADLIIDTDDIAPEEIVRLIAEKAAYMAADVVPHGASPA